MEIDVGERVVLMEIDVVSKDGDNNFMSPEGIRLFFTNFPLFSVSQHNANSIAIFRHTIYFHQYNSLAFLSIFLCVSFTVSHIALNQSAASMTMHKERHSFSHFISSDDS